MAINKKIMAQISIIQKSECLKYDFGHSLLSPDFFLTDKLNAWKSLSKNSKYSVNDYFVHIKNTVKKVNKRVICYDLTHALTKFINDGDKTYDIGSNKKVAINGDFIISRLRYYLEEMGIVEKNKFQQLFSTEFLVFRAKNKDISTYTLFVLCMTNTVQTILKRSQYGTEHPRFYDFVLENLPIPNFLFDMDKEIEKIVKQAHQKQSQAKDLYAEAENLLLAELDLLDYQPKHQLTFNASKTQIEQAQRFDAEYFQPKYADIINRIENYSGGFEILNKFIRNYSTGYPFKSNSYVESGCYLVRINNIEKGRLKLDNANKIPVKDISLSEKDIAKENDILISMSGTIGNSCKIPKGIKAIINQRIFRFTPMKFNADTLTLLINSIIGLSQLQRIGTGGVQTNISSIDIKTIKIPLIDSKIQIKIAEKITQSHQLRKESKDLLELAKTKVEQEIERKC